jgi:hypothetical protein
MKVTKDVERNRGYLQTQYYQKKNEVDLLRGKIFLLETEMESIRFAVEAIDSQYYGVKKGAAKREG